ncbi:hypothetical protein [Aquimarina mytili]|uniref:Uncharacterized protein n=1 Tax=Aquimarina mytili TaxID=874423 RepID=A0A937DD03_9FLAO|nr:hypothetical protein [Aquimarina mytili]MBL0685496.1 hypothetical protein [Aquimarina mytili]
MSGEAGAIGNSTYLQIYYSSGMTVSLAMPPDPESDSHYISNYFKEANKPFENKLKMVLPKLDTSIAALIQEHNLPIVPYDTNADYIEGVIIEDTNEHKIDQLAEQRAKNWFVNTNKPKAFLSFSFFTKEFSKITLSITVDKRILRSQLHKLRDEVLLVFEL